MRTRIILKILEMMEDVAVNTVDLTTAFLDAGYGASFNKLNYEFSKRQNARQKLEEKAVASQRFYSLLYQLQKDGLIKKSKKQKKSLWLLTKKGTQKLAVLKSKTSLPSTFYKSKKHKSKNAKLSIVIFGIPEVERKKRAWLRSALRNLEFQMMQKSVWVGRGEIPEEFLYDLKNLNLIKYVEIFAVTKSGSLQKSV